MSSKNAKKVEEEEDEGEVLAEFEGGMGEEHEEDEDGELADEVFEEEDEDYDDGEGDDEDTEPSGPDTSSRRYERHGGAVYCGALSPDGALFLSGSGDDTAHLWDARDAGAAARAAGAAPRALKGPHAESVVCCAFSADGAWAATGALDGTLAVWDAKSGELVHAPEGPAGEINFLAWHPRGSALLAGASDGSTWLWAVSRSELRFLQCFQGESSATCGAFSASGNSVLTGHESGQVAGWNPVTGAQPCSFQGFGWLEGPCNALALQPGAGGGADGGAGGASAGVFCAAGMDGTARVGSLASGRVLASFEHDRAASDDESCASVEAAAFSPAQPAWLATGATDGTLKLWDLGAGGHARQAMRCHGGVIKVAWLPGSPHLVCATTTRGVAQLFDARAGGDAQRTFTGHTGMVLDVVPTRDELYTCGNDGVVRVYAI